MWCCNCAYNIYTLKGFLIFCLQVETLKSKENAFKNKKAQLTLAVLALYEGDQGSRVRALTLLVMHGLHQLMLFWLLCKSSPFGLFSLCVFEFFFSHIWHLSLLDY